MRVAQYFNQIRTKFMTYNVYVYNFLRHLLSINQSISNSKASFVLIRQLY